MGIHSSSFTVNPVEKEIKKSRFSKKRKDKRSVYDFVYTSMDGKSLTMKWFEGHPLIIVNVVTESKEASMNYTQLTELYERYSEKGLRVIGFPCTQFKSRGEPETEGGIKEFIKRNKVTFDITSEIDVNGDSAHPLWKYMKSQTTGAFIKGDFTKFLIDKEGKVVARFEPPVEPIEMEKDILALL